MIILLHNKTLFHNLLISRVVKDNAAIFFAERTGRANEGEKKRTIIFDKKLRKNMSEAFIGLP